MKSVLKKIGYWIALPFAFLALLIKLVLESMGIIEPEEDEEEEDYY